MSVFSKKTTLVHHITYMGIMAAINLIFIILDTYIPFLMLILILLLPFASTVVSYYCLKRYYPIYALASVGLCLIFNISDTIFYIIPALITGFVIGLFLSKKIHPFWIILVSAIIESGLTFALIPLINLISNTDFINSLLTLLHLATFPYQEHLIYLLIFFLSLTQVSLTHFVLFNEIKKIGIDINTRIASFSAYINGLLISLIISLILALTYPPLSLTFVAIAYYFAAFLFIDIIFSRKKIIYVLISVLFVISFFGFAILYSKVDAPLGFILCGFFPLSVGITSFVNNYLLKAK